MATVTDQQIASLLREAAKSGDNHLVSLCDRALRGAPQAREDCALLISQAEPEGRR